MKIEIVLRFLALLSCVSFALAFWRWIAAVRFPLHKRIPPQTPLPGCTLLKPLKGCDAQTKDCLRSWLSQNYSGPVQILFGVASLEDPVCLIVRELLAEFPRAGARMVICDEDLGVNNKVSTLRHLEPLVLHPLIIISDADVMVPADFLSNLAPMFADPDVGLVSCFYRLASPSNLAMRWENIAINSDFWSSVLQAQSLMKVDFALGAVMALPKAHLSAFGGFAVLADFLADDYQLGRQVARQGKRIDFSRVVVDCHEPVRNWAQVWDHQVRWARTIRSCQPAPFFFSILDNATFWPLLWLAVGAGSWLLGTNTGAGPPQLGTPLSSLSFLLAASLLMVAFRIVTALDQERRLTGSKAHFPWFWMVPVKDLLNVAIWAAALSGNDIVWHGHRYRILSEGRLQKCP